jgi:hypothetical protein
VGELMSFYGKQLSHCFANKVYDILVAEAGAHESNRENFIYVHCEDEYPCGEYRLGGDFGFGGKYWLERNAITYYQENHMKKLDKLEAKVNKLLGEIK